MATSINDLVQWSAEALKRHGQAVIDRDILERAKSVSAVCHSWTSEQCADYIAVSTGCRPDLGAARLILTPL